MTRAQQPKTVLVVEHDPWLRTALSDTLTDAGYNVVAASNGQSGLRLAAQHQPQLVLLDAAVPEVSSREVVSELRASEATQDVPVLLIADAPAAGGSLVIDATGLVLKPVDRADLVAQVASNMEPRPFATTTWAAQAATLVADLD